MLYTDDEIACFITYSAALAQRSCQVYPSEYAYHGNSVTRMESASANCRMYPNGLSDDIYTEEYIHCDGVQLNLADSDFDESSTVVVTIMCGVLGQIPGNCCSYSLQ